MYSKPNIHTEDYSLTQKLQGNTTTKSQITTCRGCLAITAFACPKH